MMTSLRHLNRRLSVSRTVLHVTCASLILALLPRATFSKPAEPQFVDGDPSPVEPAQLDIKDVSIFRSGDEGLVFRVRCGGAVDLNRLRILIDKDGPESGEPNTGAELMLEGPTLYVHPAGGVAWEWNALLKPFISIQHDTVWVEIDGVDYSPGLRCVIETTDEKWATADRWPNESSHVINSGAPPCFDPASIADEKPVSVDLSELLACKPEALSPDFKALYIDRDWTPLTNGAMPALEWSVTPMARAIPIVFTLRDAVSGKTENFTPTTVYTNGAEIRWSGKALGVQCELISQLDERGDLSLTGLLEADSNRCLTVSIGCGMDVTDWLWHDDFRFKRDIASSSDPYLNAGSSPYGSMGLQSLFPFGVISSDKVSLVVETDPSEPRIHRISADPRNRFFGVSYDIGLTPRTRRFPGQATFRCALRARTSLRSEAFRETLAEFYRRNPDFYRSRIPRHGLWMAFQDISTLPHAEDFGFVFLERGGPPGEDVQYCEDNGILSLAYTEPWLYWLNIADKAGWNTTNAMRLMKLKAATGSDQPAEFASAALLGAARDRNGKIRMRFLPTPWSAGARMEINTDPDLEPTDGAPVSRAMSEWRAVRTALKDERIDGIYLDSMQSMQELDYGGGSLAAADYPCTFSMSELEPGVALQISAYELTSALRTYLEQHDRYLMANFPCWNFPFFMPHIDIPGEETTWYREGVYSPMEQKQLNFRRAISGAKPYGFLQASEFEKIAEEDMESYFKDCLFWGFLPSFFSHDGANAPYFQQSALYERDRHLFKTYAHLCRRISEAGWQPLSSVGTGDEALWIEQFGSTDKGIAHLTLRNTRHRPSSDAFALVDDGRPVMLVNPLRGYVRMPDFPASGKMNIKTFMMGGDIDLWDIVPLDLMPDEERFIESWSSGNGEAAALRTSLSSIQREVSEGLQIDIDYPVSLVRGETG
ncbi:MAG: hypothetical protein KJ626_10715, partial [Verrucomicrobia bacterium]|nr:hypothetical protein [Verrucomicrobiota bacterium]